MEQIATSAANRPRQSKVGRVVSDKMHKSIVVEVERRVLEPRYRRTIKKTRRFMAHDEQNAAKLGDKVRIEETRPLSKRKRWQLREILVKAEG